MDAPDRATVEALDRRRRALRESLMTDAVQAREDLHPKSLASRWLYRQRQRAGAIAEQAGTVARRSAPAIGLAGLAILLFAGRKPISRMIEKMRRQSTRPEEEGAE